MAYLIVLLSLCRETESPYWRVDASASADDEERAITLQAAFFLALQYFGDVRLVVVRVTTGEDMKPKPELLTKYEEGETDGSGSGV